MNLLITGHRIQKLENYDIGWISETIAYKLIELKTLHGFIKGFVGMASGVDLWFCSACVYAKIPYVACIPFEDQDKTMSGLDAELRKEFISLASEVKYVKNSWMVEKCDTGMVVWDGNKGGTHNVLQQLVENKKSFYWINPVKKCVWECL